MTMRVGFTGTRRGMTDKQREAFYVWICEHDVTEFHHGDCIGADDEAANVLHEIATGEDPGPPIKVVCHPPSDETHRANNVTHDEIRQPKTHFARNRDIVNETDVLVVCPCDMEHQPRGGTWMTHDYAVKVGKRIVIIWPDGRVQDTGPHTGGA